MKQLLLVAAILILKIGAAQSSVQKETTVFSETFSTNSNQWPVVTEGATTYRLWNGKYSMENTGGTTTVVSIGLEKLDLNYTVSATAFHASGIVNNVYGFFFGVADNNNGYVFGISGDGKYIVYRYAGGKLEYLINWTASTAIKQSNMELNKLKVKVSGSNFDFYINDQYVNSTSGYSVFGKKLGFIVANNQRVEFDDIAITATPNIFDNLLLDETKFSKIISDTTSKKQTIAADYDFYDDFTSNKNKWDFEETKFQIKNGKLFGESLFHKSFTAWQKLGINTQTDFWIRVVATHNSGISDAGYGLKINNEDSSLNFQITSTGYYNIYHGKKMIVGWTHNASVKTGDGVENQLMIKKNQKGLSFFINDVEVHSNLQLSSYKTVWAGAEVTGVQTIAFDDFTVSGTRSSTLKNYLDDLTGKDDDNQYELTETFADNENNWTFSPSDFQMKEGKFYGSSVKSKEHAAFFEPQMDELSDFTIGIKARHVKGSDNFGYGLQIGGGDSVISFQISSNGYYNITVGHRIVTNWTKTAAIKKGNTTANKLVIIQTAKGLRFFINDVQVGGAVNLPFYSRFRVGVNVVDEQTIEYQNLKIEGTTVDDGDWG